MKRNKIVALLFLIIMIPIVIMISIADATKVAVKDRQIYVDGKPFFVKGIGYSPVPIGIDPTITYPWGDYFIYDYKNIYDRDIPLLRKMGTNTIRLWVFNKDFDHTDFLNKTYNNKMYIIATFWMGPNINLKSLSIEQRKMIRERYYPNISLAEDREIIKQNFREMIRKNKNNSAILMWSIGNELNLLYPNQLPELFSLINEMAQIAHQEDKNHPVTTPLADVNIINIIKTYNSTSTNLDIWSAQLYRGKSFGNFFNQYKNVSKKPVLILEYGIDAYNDTNHTEYEYGKGIPYQASYTKSLWLEIKTNSNISIGGSVMAYSDEWWKGQWGWEKTGCPDHDPWYHSECGYPAWSHPDGYSNEEWWGIMKVKDNGNSVDIVQPRKVYYTFKEMWTPPASVTGLKNITYKRNYINWTWIDPKDSDFYKVKIYINGIWKKDVLKGVRYYNATNLKNNTWYKISTHTIDTYGNVNQTWVNKTAKTAK